MALCAVWSSRRKGKILRVEGTKCAVQGRIGGITAQLWRPREVVGLKNYAEKQPWRIVTTHCEVPNRKVTSNMAETV